MKPLSPTAIDVGTKFSELMLEAIGRANLKEVVVLNSVLESGRVCHSHDYCDANMVMLEAIELAQCDDDDEGVWNEAWLYAFIAGFANVLKETE